MVKGELLAPVPAAADYSVSADLWQRLEDEITLVSGRIDAGESLTPDDVANVRKLKSQVDGYVNDFNKAMRDSQSRYKTMVNKMLSDLGFDKIEQFIAVKRQEQSAEQNVRIAQKMDTLKMLSDGLLARTVKLKDTQIARELLPIFTARFPKVQSGAKDKDIADWKPYFAVISRTISIMDAFFCDEKYQDAVLLPVHAGTIRELLAYAKDGKDEHLGALKTKFQEDQHFIQEAKLKNSMSSKADGIARIKSVLEKLEDTDGLSEGARNVRMEQAWGEISLIVRLINNMQ